MDERGQGVDHLIVRQPGIEPGRGEAPHQQQLGLSYRESPLSKTSHPEPGSLRAGDRAPDGRLSNGRVFDLLRGPHPTLLAVNWPGELPDLGVPAYRIDEAREAYDAQGPALYLVRPDNYVGCLTVDPEDIAAYLKQIGH